MVERQPVRVVVVRTPATADCAWTSLQAQAGLQAKWCEVQAEDLLAASRHAVVQDTTAQRVLIRADVQMPDGWLRTLLSLAANLPVEAVLTTLGDHDTRLFPVLAGTAMPALPQSHWAAACHVLAPALLWPIPAGSAVLLVLGAGVRDPATAAKWLTPQWYTRSRDGMQAAPALPADERERDPEPLWAELAGQLAGAPADWAPQVADPQRPVILHLLHGWGGGAERFVLDLARADRERRHLLLRAVSNAQRQQHGEALQLLDAACPHVVLGQWRLTPEISNLAATHAHYRAVLQAVLDRHGVAQVWVSSLIGHALEVLELGCPLRWIAHDYFPFWPVLDVDYSDPARQFDAREREADLRARPGSFAPEPAAEWALRADAVSAALRRRQVPLVVPDASVHAHLMRIRPELAELPWRAVAHGIELPTQGALPPMPTRERLRILVPGRIAGGKGMQLLEPALEGLLAVADVYLLGCGSAGMRLFGRSGVHVELDYAPHELEARVRRIAPDLALLPRTIAETFSYVLSEMRALGVPVLGTRTGSLSLRIQDGVDGWLCAPDAQALVAAVHQLAADPARLRAMAASTAALPVRDLQAMRADHLAALTAEPPRAPAPASLATMQGLQTLHQAAMATRLRHDLEHAQQHAQTLQAEVHQRGEWGQGLARLVEERTRWALGLETSLQDERRVYAEELHRRQGELDQLSHTHASLRAECEQAQEALQRLHEQAAQISARLAETDAHLKQAEADLATERTRLAALLTSTSWRLTAPMRVLIRALRRARESLAFRLRSLRQLGRRGMNSLRQRGLQATMRRLLRGAAQPASMALSTAPLAAEETPFHPFALPDRGAPVVSVVIPVYNNFAYTEACLRALARVEDATPFEVIVVDDASTDASWTHLQQIGGIVVERNAQNQGFIGTCNRGAARARGDYVFFLNNDTQVQDGFLAELLKVFASKPDAGLVGSRLIYPDGRLQESGGIIFSDGSGWNYGRFEDPQHAHYTYVREVDYVSGAAIALPRALFEALGGFDPIYAPAYYEDTDLAFKVRAVAGRKVYVAPRSRVVHYEGISNGTDTGSGIKRHQVINQQTFLQRWDTVLRQHPAPGTDILLARQHRVRGRVLVIDACTPMPDQDSGSLRMYNLLDLLLQSGHAVTFFNEDRAYHPGYAEALQDLGVEMLFHPWLSDVPAFFRERGRQFDVVILSRHYVAERFLPLVKDHAPQAQVWFDTVDLHYLRERRAAELNGDTAALKASQQTMAQELALMRRCDLTLVVSAVEQQLLAVDCPGARVEILSNIHAIPGRERGAQGRRDLCFIGGFQHPPNVDAVLWFVREVWPHVLAEAPDLVLHLIGSRTPPQITELASAQVIVHGFVADLTPFMRDCRMSIAPLRYGAGVKGKVNMSMSYGLPVVATDVAVEGMFLVDGTEALVADSPAAFAAAVLRLNSDDALWERLSLASIANVERHFSLDAARSVLERLLDAPDPRHP